MHCMRSVWLIVRLEGGGDRGTNVLLHTAHKYISRKRPAALYLTRDTRAFPTRNQRLFGKNFPSVDFPPPPPISELNFIVADSANVLSNTVPRRPSC